MKPLSTTTTERTTTSTVAGMTLTRDDEERGDRVVVTLVDGDEGTEEHAVEVTALDDHRIRINPDTGSVTRVRVGVDGIGQPAGAEVETHHRELARQVEELEFE